MKINLAINWFDLNFLISYLLDNEDQDLNSLLSILVRKVNVMIPDIIVLYL